MKIILKFNNSLFKNRFIFLEGMVDSRTSCEAKQQQYPNIRLEADKTIEMPKGLAPDIVNFIKSLEANPDTLKAFLYGGMLDQSISNPDKIINCPAGAANLLPINGKCYSNTSGMLANSGLKSTYTNLYLNNQKDIDKATNYLITKYKAAMDILKQKNDCEKVAHLINRMEFSNTLLSRTLNDKKEGDPNRLKTDGNIIIEYDDGTTINFNRFDSIESNDYTQAKNIKSVKMAIRYQNSNEIIGYLKIIDKKSKDISEDVQISLEDAQGNNKYVHIDVTRLTSTDIIISKLKS